MREDGSEGAITEATRDSVCEDGSDLDLYACDGRRHTRGRVGLLRSPRGGGHEEGRGHRWGQDVVEHV